MRGGGLAGRHDGGEHGVWDGRFGTRRTAAGGFDFRSGVGEQAVHGGGGADACSTGQIVAGRRGAQVHSGAAGLRRAADHPPPAESHQRTARLGQRGGDCGMAAHHARLHACACAGHFEPAARAQLSAGRGVLVHEQRLQSGGDAGGAGVGKTVCRVHPREYLSAAGDDVDELAGRFPADCEGSRDCVFGEQRYDPADDAVRGRATATEAC